MRATSRARAVRKSLARARRLLVGQVRATSRFRAVRESLLIFLGGVLRNLFGVGRQRERERETRTDNGTNIVLNKWAWPGAALSFSHVRAQHTVLDLGAWPGAQARRLREPRDSCVAGCSTNVYALLTVSEVYAKNKT